MSSMKLKAAALSAFVFTTLASPYAHAASIKVAVAANFTATLAQLINVFTQLYPSVSVTYASDSSGNLQTQIINHTVAYDLFLSADQSRPQTLATSYPSLVIGSPFLYSVGELELWSKTVDISAGLPSPIPVDIVLADPNKAPYGTAAAQVLSASPWSITWTPGSAYPPSGTAHVFTKSNIGQTYSAINDGAYAYGFVHQSAICKLVGGVKTFTQPGGYHHTYPYNDTTYPHSQISQYGIKIVNSARTSADDTALTNFVNFITANTSGTNIIKSYCYSLTL
ncbi:MULTISPECIES: molybdate ABC transporter substrate-binding protein [Methylocystis]|uniref:Molybdate-binding periplasmic protein ModA n=1 Tax=Methylocystis iwaonis TaxID=2885079 RepID=A0ABM8E4Y6_9HYPH|nr:MULTISPECIES: molybdate ABC transporter substrate-binding protein [Methylocystis]MDJ0449544.1 molybdate ABC transporter substrate-binding protein [Methylocystis sp. JR02]BDV32916.1 molybdate-binding periplasmic protein ModA [Methylocystis iwaonis]